MTEGLPSGVLIAFYGDDFTGSTDAMEVTALAGLRTVLFTRIPEPEDLSDFAGYQVIGIAGTARSRGPTWMEANLPHIFAVLASLRPRILQYKVCSTFDSAPDVGSIGRATELGALAAPPGWIPIVVGAPQLGRWQAFGNLFAAAGGVNYRIDRHPTMSRHPVTPMDEADLKLHLAQQTELEITGIDLGDMGRGSVDDKIAQAQASNAIAFIDVADPASQVAAGRMIWESSVETVFSPGSSGLQYALVAHWRAQGALAKTPPGIPGHAAVNRLLVLSGSCAPVTADQIAHAETDGFASIRLDVCKAASPDEARTEVARVLDEIATAFGRYRGVIVFAARTVDDPAYTNLSDFAAGRGMPLHVAQAAIGTVLGAIALAAVPRFHLKRVVVAGGDTSGRVLEMLPVKALELKYPLAPGTPVCRCHVNNSAFEGLELILKGGQLGMSNLFSRALDPRRFP